MWIALLLLASSAAWAEDPAPAGPPTTQTLTSWQATLTDCEQVLQTTQGKVDHARRNPTKTGPEGPSDLRQDYVAYREQCGMLRQTFDTFRADSKISGRAPAPELASAERRLMTLLQAERKVEGGIKVIEIEQHRRTELERRQADAEQRRAEAEQRRKEETQRRATEANVRRLQQTLPKVIEKRKDVLGDK